MTYRGRKKNKIIFYSEFKMLKNIINTIHLKNKNQAQIVYGVQKLQYWDQETEKRINQINYKITIKSFKSFYSKNMIMQKK